MTKKPEEIEGSEARAKDRGTAAVFSFIADDPNDDRPYLGDPDEVEMLVRQFCAEAQRIQIEAGAARMTHGDALQALDKAARDTSAIFMGQSTAYRAMPFNAPDQIGPFVKQRMGIEGEPSEACYVMLMNTATQIMAAFVAHQNGEADDDATKFQIDAAVEDATSALLGLPVVAE